MRPYASPCATIVVRPLAFAPASEIEVDESWARDVDFADASCGEIESVDQFLREHARFFAERLREHHREVGAPVTVHGIARPLEHGSDRVRRTELTRGIEQRRTNEFDGHHSEELLLLGALGFDSAGFVWAAFESDAFDVESDF